MNKYTMKILEYLDIDRQVPFMDPITEIAIRTGIIHAITPTVCSAKVWKKSNQILEIRSRKDQNKKKSSLKYCKPTLVRLRKNYAMFARTNRRKLMVA